MKIFLKKTKENSNAILRHKSFEKIHDCLIFEFNSRYNNIITHLLFFLYSATSISLLFFLSSSLGKKKSFPFFLYDHCYHYVYITEDLRFVFIPPELISYLS